MSDPKDDPIDALCEAVADGTPVDWDSEGPRSESSGVLDELRIVERIAKVHRAETRRTEQEHAQTSASLSRAILEAFPNGAWGSLQIRGVLDRGGFADVFVAFDPGLRREVALKVLRQDRRHPRFAEDRLFDEAQRLARVRHTNVVTVHGVARFDGRIGIWSDRIEGQTLEKLLAERGPLGAHEAASVGVQLCRALAALHGAGIVHGDVTAKNVMREQGGRIVLMDFGASSDSEGPEQPWAFGTLAAMSPERLRGERADYRSDLYSLGVLLWRLLTGKYPHTATTTDSLLQAIEDGSQPRLRDLRPELPITLIQTIEKAMDPDPARRHSSAGAFEAALASAVDVPRPRRLVILLSVLLSAALMAAVTFLFMRRGGENTLSGNNSPLPTTSQVTQGDAADGEIAVPPPTPTPAPPIAVSVALNRVRAGTASTLSPGDPVAPGDALFLELQVAEPLHVYVLDEDEQGGVFVLFPVQGITPENPLSAGMEHRLPGQQGERTVNWQVTSVGGSETVIVLASRQPLVDLEREITGFPRTELNAPISYHSIGSEALARLRGIGGMVESSGNESSSHHRLADVLSRLSPGHAGNLWVWQIVLANRGH